MRITLKKLEKAKACSRERKRFARLFPNGCELNEKNLRKWAYKKTLDGLQGSMFWLLDAMCGVECWKSPGDRRLDKALDSMRQANWCDEREEFLKAATDALERVAVLEKRKRKRRKK